MPLVSVEAIAKFTSVTGISARLARQKLEEHEGNLEAAITAHFEETERSGNYSATSGHRFGDRRNRQQSDGGILPLLSAARSFRPSLLLDPQYRLNLYGQVGSAIFNGDRGRQQNYDSAPYPEYFHAYGVPAAQPYGYNVNNGQPNLMSGVNEEELMRQAVEASREEYLSSICQREVDEDVDEIAEAIALSLKTAEDEIRLRKSEKPKIRRESDDSSSSSTTPKINDTCFPAAGTLPPEPSESNETSISLIIRMPDGTRHCRRFLKIHKLKDLFHFIDATGAVNPGSYKLVRQYPRRSLRVTDLSSTFEDLGMKKQEMLFVEMN